MGIFDLFKKNGLKQKESKGFHEVKIQITRLTKESVKVTFDIPSELKSTFDWKIFVEGKSFTLKDNDALVFSGTNQLHWRERINFKKDDFVDMLFCHFIQDCEDPKVNSKDFQKNLEIKELELKLKYKNNTL
jgi:mannosyltransferase OCH1-like enzyme